MTDSKTMRGAAALAALAAAGVLAGCSAQGDAKDRPAKVTSTAEAPRQAQDHVLGEFGHDDPEIAEADAICGALGRRPSLDGAAAGAVSTAPSVECDPVALYYGVGGPADPARARQCAQALVDSGDGDPGLYGNGVLINVYANGKGAPRDLDRALRYACDDGMASGFDRAVRVKKLEALKSAGRPSAAYDYCDDASSDYVVGQCMDIKTGRAEAERARRYAALTADWSAEQKAALVALRQAEDAFAEARAEDETSMWGTDRVWTARAAAEDVHVFTFKLFETAATGGLPEGSTGTAAAADRALNTTYGALMKSGDLADKADGGTVMKSGVRATQRTWLKYRDAWLALASKAWPGSQDALATKLTEARTQQLKCMPDPFDDACSG